MLENNHDKIFRESMKELISYPIENESDDTEKHHANRELLTRIKAMIREESVSLTIIINVLYENLQMYPTRKYFVLRLTRTFAKLVNEGGSSNRGFEFAWLIANSGFLDEIMNVSQIEVLVKTLVEIADKDFARSYINYMLIKNGLESADVAIFAYYYTHYDVRSLRTIKTIIPITSQYIKILSQVFQGTSGFILSLKSSLTKSEKQFLVEFLQKGLTLNSEHIAEHCNKALDKLLKV